MQHKTIGQVSMSIIWVAGVALIMLSLIGLVVGVVQERVDSITDDSGSTTTAVTNTTFTDLPGDWDNATWGDNVNAEGENNAGIWENMVWDNCGPTPAGAASCLFYQDITVPTHDSVTTARITAEWQLVENDNLDNFTVAVILGRPGGDNVEIYVMDNTIHAESDSTWYSVDNTITSSINAAGVYILYLEDNTDRLGPNTPDNYVSCRWDNATFSVTTVVHPQYAENLVDDAGGYAEENFPLLGLVITVGIIGAMILIFRSVS